MVTKNDKTWQFGSTTASLLVAYMLVLQGFAVGFALSPKTGQLGIFANSVCLNGETQSNNNAPGMPSQSRGHGDKCCVFHYSGAGIPPVALWNEALFRTSYAQAVWSEATTRTPMPWPTLPVGSRAPPTSIL